MFKDPKTISLIGNVGKEIIFYFYYNDISLVSRIESSCECTGVRNQVAENRIVAHYMPKPVPIHLQPQGYYSTIQTITVTYNDLKGVEKTEELILTAKISK